MNIPEIEELLAKITPGEWSCEMNILYGPNDDGTGISMDNTDDAIFIAAAPRMIRQLLAQVKEQEPNIQFLVNKIADLQAQLSRYDAAICDLASEHGYSKVQSMPPLDYLAGELTEQKAQLSRTQKAGEALAKALENADDCIIGVTPEYITDSLQNWNALQKGEQK